jgi:hypothetical protein
LIAVCAIRAVADSDNATERTAARLDAVFIAVTVLLFAWDKEIEHFAQQDVFL